MKHYKEIGHWDFNVYYFLFSVLLFYTSYIYLICRPSEMKQNDVLQEGIWKNGLDLGQLEGRFSENFIKSIDCRLGVILILKYPSFKNEIFDT